MNEGKSYQLAALAMGMTAGVTVAALLPNMDWLLIASTALSGYVGCLLPDIDQPDSNHYRTIYLLSRIAAFIAPCIQFFYRPTDLLIALPIALLLISQFWHYVKQIVSREGHTHSLLAAVCLSLAVAWVAYLTAGVPAIIPAFIASSVGYVLHLLLDDLTRIDLMPRRVAKTALSTLGQGHSQELYSIVAIGALSGIAMWLL